LAYNEVAVSKQSIQCYLQ